MGKTDKGLRRQNNEDAFFVTDDQNYSAVADGMGGAAAGEVASALFIETVETLFARLPQPREEQELVSLVSEAFTRANERILRCAEEHPENQGMGCTAELIAFFDDRYTLGHVGDSRTYLFREGELRQLSKDHSLVQHQVDEGVISPQQARTHALKNVILRALGLEPALSLDLIRGRIFPQDLFLLCSDGLSDMLEDAEIAGILGSDASLQGKLHLLIEAALHAGGRDNVTVVLCQVVP